ncbi:MazG-like family protein [Enterococcus saccharolyticus]|uniref:MazG-like family protein n=1 Tax=Enterococcus TaxID=1350 RepID=UPI001E471B56|nr:MazG-like family protein [Enterococcus saccharolyticus]MCD5003415.1 MazG-like family protein [Enterococcus saccharolyticus]
MDIQDYKSWVIDFYKKRNWYQYNPFIRIGFLTEEVGEVSRAVRSLEIGRDRPDEATQPEHVYKENLMEELGDVLDNILVLADKYDISLEDILTHHQMKLEGRFRE